MLINKRTEAFLDIQSNESYGCVSTDLNNVISRNESNSKNIFQADHHVNCLGRFKHCHSLNKRKKRAREEEGREDERRGGKKRGGRRMRERKIGGKGQKEKKKGKKKRNRGGKKGRREGERMRKRGAKGQRERRKGGEERKRGGKQRGGKYEMNIFII